MKMSFKRVLVRNNSVCPYCSRVVADNCDRKTFIKHMDSACCPKENQPLRENLATDTENDNEESGANAMGEDAVDGSVSDTPLEEDVRDIQNPNACWKKHRIRHIVKEYCPRVVVQGEHYGIFVTPESKKDFNSSCDFAYERMAIALIEDARAHKYDSTWAQEQARLYVDLGSCTI